MILGIMQPYFMPYIGYFQLMKAVDKYVIYDDVNYIKGGWVSRNNILVNGEKKTFTIVLKGASSNKLFNEIEIGDDFRKLMKTLQFNYSKALFFDSTMNLLDKIISYPERNFALFIQNSFKEIFSYLDIHTEILLSSSLKKNMSLRGEEKVINICSLLGSTKYFNAIGGQELYSKSEFRKNNIDLYFLNTIIKEYPQNVLNFIPYLSIIDVLMNNSKENTNLLLDSFSLQ
ncbi:MAG: WbqC family protein [Bacteroides sp.]